MDGGEVELYLSEYVRGWHGEMRGEGEDIKARNGCCRSRWRA